MQLSLRRSFLALGALSLALTPFSMVVQAQPGVGTQLSGAGRTAAQNRRFAGLDTLQGTVTRRRDNNEFDVRVGGATFRVRSSNLVTLRTGDRVTLRGTFRSNDAFEAQSVRVAGANSSNSGDYDADYGSGNYGSGSYGSGSYGSGGYGNGGYNNGGYDSGNYNGSNGPSDYVGNVDFAATVSRVLSAREVEVRGDNGRVYRVSSLDNVSYLRVGTRLRVRGQSSGTSRIINARLLSGTGNQNGTYAGSNEGYGGYGAGTTSRTVDFPGRVVGIDTARNEATVRGDNGRNYIVRGAAVDSFQTGNHVRVRGEVNGNVIELDRLDLVL